MKPYIFLSLPFLFCQDVYAESSTPASGEAVTQVSGGEPSAVFPADTDQGLLTSINVGKNRKLTCPIVNAPSFILSNAQAYSMCYDAQVACIRWSLVKNLPDSEARRFVYTEAMAYLLTCVLGIAPTASGGGILAATGYFSTDSDKGADAVVTSDQATANIRGAKETPEVAAGPGKATSNTPPPHASKQASAPAPEDIPEDNDLSYEENDPADRALLPLPY